MSEHILRALCCGDDLNAALRRLSKAIGKEWPSVPILQGVHIAPDPVAGELRLTVTDLDAVFSVAVPAVIESAAPAVVTLAAFAAIVSKLPKGSQVEAIGDRFAAGRTRWSLTSWPAADYPIEALAKHGAAFSMTMAAGPLLALLTQAAKDAAPPGGGDSKGAQFAFAADGLTVTAGTGLAITRRRYALPALRAGDLAFAPKPGAAILATFEAAALKRLALMIDKPGKGDGEGEAVAVGFAVDAGIITAALIDADGAQATVKAAGIPMPAGVADMAAAPRLHWFDCEGDDLAKAIEGAGQRGEAAPDLDIAVNEGGGVRLSQRCPAYSIDVPAAPGADLARCQRVRLVALVAKAAKGGGLVSVYQLESDRWHNVAVIVAADGAESFIACNAEQPQERALRRFVDAYAPAWAARDGEAMRAAVAAYVAAGGAHVAAVAATVRGHKASKARVAVAAMAGKHSGGGFDIFELRVSRLAEDAATTARGYSISVDRRGVSTLKPCDDGRAERLVAGIVGKWNIPIVMTPAQATRFEALYAAGFDGKAGETYVNGGRVGRGWRQGFYPWVAFHPEGISVPKATRAKAGREAPQAPPAVARHDAPEIAPDVASASPDKAASAIEPEAAADDLAEASEGFNCTACGRPESDCSADPCPAVVNDREATCEAPATVKDGLTVAPDLAATVAALAATVAALQARLDTLDSSAVPVADPEPVPVADDADTVAHWKAKAFDIARQRGAANAKGDLDRLAAKDANKRAEAAEKDSADWQAIAEQNHAALLAERERLADMTANRDSWIVAADLRLARAERLAAKRDRTAARLRAVRQSCRELETMNAGQGDIIREAESKVADALRVVTDEAARANRLADDLARVRRHAPLAGIRFVRSDFDAKRFANAA